RSPVRRGAARGVGWLPSAPGEHDQGTPEQERRDRAIHAEDIGSPTGNLHLGRGTTNQHGSPKFAQDLGEIGRKRVSRPERTPATALSQVLDFRGFDSDQIREITHLLGAYRSPRALRPGTTLLFSAGADSVPDRIRLELNPDSLLHFVRSDSLWTTRIESVPFVMDTVRISGAIESSLWSAHLSGDLERFGKKDF